MPEVVKPGELPAPPEGMVALQLYDAMGDYTPYETMNLHLWGTDKNPDSGCSGLSDSAANSDWMIHRYNLLIVTNSALSGISRCLILSQDASRSFSAMQTMISSSVLISKLISQKWVKTAR